MGSAQFGCDHQCKFHPQKFHHGIFGTCLRACLCIRVFRCFKCSLRSAPVKSSSAFLVSASVHGCVGMAGADDEVHAHAVCHAGSWAGNDFLGFDDSLTRAASFLTCVVSSGVEPPRAANAWILAILAAATVSGALFMPAPLARKRSIMDAMINVYAGRATARGCETWGVN